MCDANGCSVKCPRFDCRHIAVPEKEVVRGEPYICQDQFHNYRCPYKSDRHITNYTLPPYTWKTPASEMQDNYTVPAKLPPKRLRREFLRDFYKRTLVNHVDALYFSNPLDDPKHPDHLTDARTFKSTYTQDYYDEKYKDDVDTKTDYACLSDPKRRVYDTDNIITVWNPYATKPAPFRKKNIITKPLNEVMDCNVR